MSETEHLTEQQIRNWLLTYAWLGAVTEQEAEVDCIMAQGDWQHVSGRIDQAMGQRSGERSVVEDMLDAHVYVLSALYECHAEPHLATCPRA